MRILGIDYGKRKMGFAVGDTETKLAEPLKVLRYRDINLLSEQIEKIVSELNIEKIVLGISEGKMAEETMRFGRKLEEKTGIPIIYQDETLTTHEAQELSIKAGIKRKKRRALEDAYSATLVLQRFLDKNLLY
ncbi:hypothetical protein A2955_04595 [Candidatus Woesebacteria bacterium RIFCSPLOWO2_01_FULL_37_19]|uniref:Putative pre-16S rRNA nuclease n=2 Tax=Candidatus Woeseibacteriota TaxID=1752722 RepID=A0A1F8BAK3_9BACT|nr:MAG: hypothetical protein A2771_01555 [Candidatus Woesebacteria bacterium RIFCSPHIGHO2_01_FULL_38_26b]OGM61074.1 MAG: hypothetical protein A2955_04595 [Candidatus Woesebacteria bacterium RIFCSPLOWO2_01_FULL_37_19]